MIRRGLVLAGLLAALFVLSKGVGAAPLESSAPPTTAPPTPTPSCFLGFCNSATPKPTPSPTATPVPTPTPTAKPSAAPSATPGHVAATASPSPTPSPTPTPSATPAPSQPSRPLAAGGLLLSTGMIGSAVALWRRFS